MRTLTKLGLLLVLATSTATVAEAKPAIPPELMASVAITTGPGLQPLRDLANAFKPGAGMMLTDAMVKQVLTNMVHAKGLDGLDTSGWAYVLVVEGGEVALLAKAADEKALAASTVGATLVVRDHWALVGSKSATDKVSAYAFEVLGKQAAPNAPLATVYAPNVLAKYKSKVAGAKAAFTSSAQGGQMAEFMGSYFDAMLTVAADTQRITIGIDATPQAATLDIALVPTAGSRLAGFVGAQKPSAFELLDKLPPTQASFLLAGHLETGPYRAGMIDLMIKMYSASIGTDLGSVIDAIMKASTGELAMTADLGGGRGLAMTQVFTIADPKPAEAAVVRLLALFKTTRTIETMGYTTSFKTNASPTTHDGVAIRGYEISYDFSKLPAAQQTKMKAMFPGDAHTRIALFDKFGTIVIAPKADAEMGVVIDVARGHGSHFTPSAQVSDLLATARTRKDSFAFVIDFASVLAAVGQGNAIPGASAPGVIALGFADKQLHLRLATTLATIKTLMHVKP